MTDLLRDEIKYVRDLAKQSYKKGEECFICGDKNELQFHHFKSLTKLWNKWKKDNKLTINSVDDILKYREVFKTEFLDELYDDTVTLCKKHHMEDLHRIYGKSPELITAAKQKRWCDRMREKHYVTRDLSEG